MPDSKSSSTSLHNNSQNDSPRSPRSTPREQPARIRTHPSRISLPANEPTREEEEDENTALLSASSISTRYRYNNSGGTTPRQQHISRINSMAGSLHIRKTPTRTDISYPTSPLFLRSSGLRTPRLARSLTGNLNTDDTVWYDQFTSTDWVSTLR